MAEFFETEIEDLEKSNPPSVPSRNRKKSKKRFKKRKEVAFNDSKYEDSEEAHKGKKFCKCHSTCGHTTDECTTLKALVKQVKQKKENISRKSKGSPSMRDRKGEKGHEKEEIEAYCGIMCIQENKCFQF